MASCCSRFIHPASDTRINLNASISQLRRYPGSPKYSEAPDSGRSNKLGVNASRSNRVSGHYGLQPVVFVAFVENCIVSNSLIPIAECALSNTHELAQREFGENHIVSVAMAFEAASDPITYGSNFTGVGGTGHLIPKPSLASFSGCLRLDHDRPAREFSGIGKHLFHDARALWMFFVSGSERRLIGRHFLFRP